ncbi:MAG: AMIN domain-containing protein [Elusimicrobia bacterium]|nr:AMIN domain-containing protein [Elusimicrobiota bacterium]
MKQPFMHFAAALLLALAASSAAAANLLQDVEAGNDEVFIKIVPPVKYNVDIPKKKQKLILDFKDTLYPLGLKTLEGQGAYLQQVRWSRRGTEEEREARVVIDLKQALPKSAYKIVESPEGLRILMGDAVKKAEQKPEAATDESESLAAAADLIPEPAITPAPVIAGGQDFVVKPQDSTLSSKTVHLNIKSMPLNLILDAISKQTGASFVVEKGLEDKRFSAVFNNLPVRDALRALLEVNGLGYESVGNTNTFVVKELSKTNVRLATKIFRLKNIQLYAMGSGTSSLLSGGSGGAKGGMSGGGAMSAPAAGGGSGKSQMASGGFLDVIKEMVSKQGHLQVYPETNSLIISDLPENFAAIEEILDSLDTPVPQVMIEAYFVEINANNSRNLGIEYGGDSGELGSFQGNSSIVAFPFTINGKVFPLTGNGSASPTWTDTVTDSIDPTGNISTTYNGVSLGILSFQQLTAVLKAIETTGDAQYLSKPKILTLNNKPAEIASTADTVIEFTTEMFTGPGYLCKQSVTPKRKDTGITLWVTPQVNDGGTITLAISPVVSRPETSQFFPSSDVVDTQKRYINTTVRVKDGSTVLIGGLLTNDETKTLRRVPLLGHIPIIGYFFSSVSKSAIKRELLIFITPKVVN